MKKTIILFLIVGMLLAGSSVFAENEHEENGEVTNVEIAMILEEINQKLGKMTGKDELQISRPGGEKAPGFGFGGAPYWPVRILFDIDKMNSYVAGIGEYEAYPLVLVPLRDGGGGTSRWVFSKNFQMGMNYWGSGFSSKGQQHHPAADSVLVTDYPVYGIITVDENGDSLDDYYTYASYGNFYWSMLFQGKAPIGKRFSLLAGAQVGFGAESFSISRNDRTTGPLSGNEKCSV